MRRCGRTMSPVPLFTAFLFPGQGSQTAEMREEVAAARPDLLALACEVVGEDPFARVEDGTRFAQPAIYCASVVGFERLRAAGLTADAVAYAGHSLGEVAALAAAGALSAEDGLRLVATRGRLMQESGERAGNGSMLALLGNGAADRADAVAQAAGLTVANDNAPNQVVLSGAKDAFEAAAGAPRGAAPGDRRVPRARDGRRAGRAGGGAGADRLRRAIRDGAQLDRARAL